MKRPLEEVESRESAKRLATELAYMSLNAEPPILRFNYDQKLYEPSDYMEDVEAKHVEIVTLQDLIDAEREDDKRIDIDPNYLKIPDAIYAKQAENRPSNALVLYQDVLGVHRKLREDEAAAGASSSSTIETEEAAENMDMT